jgi:FkbM family methyltransferase
VSRSTDAIRRRLPAPLKELVRTVATRLGRPIGALPNIEFPGTILIELFRRQRIDCVLDVGAHIGQYGRFLRNLGYTGLICSFEPLPESFGTLSKRAAADGRWRVFNYGLGERAGRFPLHVAGTRQFSSLLAPSPYSLAEFGLESVVERVEEVEIRTLDLFMRDLLAETPDARLFVKLDTQGYDLKVLEGAGPMTARILGLQTEVAVQLLYGGASTYLEALPRLQQLGFELAGVFPVTRDRHMRIIELDCVFTRA